MATKSAIGKIAGDAMNDLAAAMKTISDAVGIEPLALHQVSFRDPAYQEAMRLRSLADWTMRIADALQPVAPQATATVEPEKATRLRKAKAD